MAKIRGLCWFGVLVLLLMGCQGTRPVASMWLSPDTPTWVHFPLKTDLQTYTFSASPDAATILTIYNLSSDLTYAAELRNARGTVISSLTGSAPNTALTLNPGSDVYQLTIKSTGAGVAGALSVTASNRLHAAAVIAPFQLVVDRWSWGRLNESLTPGDAADLIEISISSLLPQPPDNYAEFTLTLTCDGAGAAWARWGAPQSPSFPCNSGVVLPFLVSSSRQTFAVALAAGAPGGVTYTLTAARH